MLIWKTIKFVVKLSLGLIIGVFIVGWIISGIISYHMSGELPFDNVTYMKESYGKNAEVPKGTWCECPVCGENFYKSNSPCCSQKCEKDYWDCVNAFNKGEIERKKVESYGKKFK